MYGCKRLWWAVVVGVAAIGSLRTAVGQEYFGSNPAIAPIYDAAVSPAGAYESAEATEQFRAASFGAAEQDLATRVKSLEAEIKKMKDKEAADKKRAAGAPSIKVRGRIHWDTATFGQNAAAITQAGAGDREAYNSTYFRRARIGVQGDAFHVVEYCIEMDFAGQTAFKDVFIRIKELPLLQNVQAGHYKEPFSLEELTSANYITFMERSLINTLGGVGGRKLGVMAFGCSECEYATWAISLNTSLSKENPPSMPFDWRTGNKDDFNGEPTYPTGSRYGLFDDNGGYAVTMRATYLPWYDEATEGAGLLHTGISYSYRDIPTLVPGQTQRYRVRARIAPTATWLVDSGFLDDTDHLNAIQPEVALVYGPFSFQAEYLWLFLDRTANPDPTFDGGYIQVSYFLTGEHRPYDKKRASFGRVKPFENFFRVRGEDAGIFTGKGAWEVAYRCDYVNLNNATVTRGRGVDHTLGLNWYLNPYTRMMFNYIHSENTGRAPGPGVTDAFLTRVQIDF